MNTPFLPLPLRSLATTAACALLTASALAQAPAPAPGTPATPPAPGAAPATAAPKPLGTNEKTFVKNASKSIFYLLELAKAGKTTITDVNLSRFRDSTITDLTKAWTEISKLATDRGEKIAGELAASEKSDIDRLGKMKEDKFSKQWLEDMTKEAKKLDKDFESTGKSTQDPDVKTFTSNYGPIVRGTFTGSEKALAALAQKKK